MKDDSASMCSKVKGFTAEGRREGLFTEGCDGSDSVGARNPGISIEGNVHVHPHSAHSWARPR